MKDKPNDQVRREGMKQYGFGPEAMKNTKVCKKCGASSPADSRYCRACGARLPDETLFEAYKRRHICCPYCDTVLDSPTEFCPQCGRRLPPPQRVKEESK